MGILLFKQASWNILLSKKEACVMSIKISLIVNTITAYMDIRNIYIFTYWGPSRVVVS